MSRWMGLVALCGVVWLAGCGQRSSAGASGAGTVTAVSGASTTALTATTGTVIGTVTSNRVGSTTTGTVGPGGRVTPAQQTEPAITPTRGGRQTVFVVHLTSRTRLGAHGIVSAVYRVSATGPAKQGCDREATSMLDHGVAGQHLAVMWRPALPGWCPGVWRGMVLLALGPNCPGGPGHGQKPVCPKFASRLTEVGRFEWRVSMTATGR